MLEFWNVQMTNLSRSICESYEELICYVSWASIENNSWPPKIWWFPSSESPNFQVMAPIFRGFLLLVSGLDILYSFTSHHPIIHPSIQVAGEGQNEVNQASEAAAYWRGSRVRQREESLGFFLFFLSFRWPGLDDFWRWMDSFLNLVWRFLWLRWMFFFGFFEDFNLFKGDMKFFDWFLGVDGVFWTIFWGEMDYFERFLGGIWSFLKFLLGGWNCFNDL